MPGQISLVQAVSSAGVLGFSLEESLTLPRVVSRWQMKTRLLAINFILFQVVIPEILRKPELEDGGNEKVWQRLATLSSERKARMREKVVRKDDALPLQFISEEFALGLLEEKCSNISEYDKFQFIWEFCNTKMEDQASALSYMKDIFQQHFNFALMSLEERLDAIQIGIPEDVVYNALLKSSILVPEDISFFTSAFQQLGWCLLSSSSHSEFDPQQHLLSLTEGGGVLVIFQLPDLVALVFLFPGPLSPGEGIEMDAGNMQVFFISRRFNLRRQFICPNGFFYDLTAERFQIYRDNNRTRSFFWFRSGVHPTVKQDPLKSLNEMLLCVSIDLTAFPGNLITTRSQLSRRHPLITKSAFSLVEVFRLPSGQEPTYLGVEQANWIEEVPEEDDKELEGEREERDASDLLLEKIEMEEDAGPTPPLILLQELVIASAPSTVDTSKEVTVRLRRILAGFQPDLKESFLAASCLSRLGQPYLAAELLDKMVPSGTVDLVAGVEEWRHLFYLDTESVWRTLERLIVELKTSMGEENKGEEYLVTQLWHNLVELLVQLRQFKEELGESREVARGLRLESVETLESEEGSETLCVHGSGHASWLAEETVVGVCLSRYYTDTFRSVIALASVSQITPAPLSLKLRLLDQRPRILDPEWLGEDSLTIVSLKSVNSIVYSRVVEALKVHLPTMGKNLLKLTRPDADEATDDEDEVQLKEIDKLNSSQRNAVSTALRQKVTIIQGPPGTGKTQVPLLHFCHYLLILSFLKVAVSIITSAVGMGVKVLAIAETNIAVDNMTRRLARIGVAVLRLGRVEKVDGDMVEYTLEGQLKTQAEQESRKVKFTDQRTGRSIPKKADLARVINKADVVLTTCAGAGDPMLRF